MSASDPKEENAAADEDVVEIPAHPAASKKDSKASGGILPTVLGLLGLTLIAVIGYGSTNEWFGLFAESDSVPGPELQKENPLSNGDQTDSNRNLPASRNLAGNGNPSSADSQTSDEETARKEDLPPLDPIPSEKAVEVIEECKRVANHLYGTMPNSLEAKEMLARTEFEFGDTAKARVVWESILKLNPQFLYALRGLGDIATQEGELELAVNYYRKACECDPTSISRRVTLGVALTQAAKLEEAKTELESALENNPGHGGALAELGQVLLLLKDFEGAKTRLEAALAAQIPPNNIAKPHLGLVTAYQRLRDREKAKFHQVEYQKLSRDGSQVNSETRDYNDLAAIREDVGRFYVDMARVYVTGGFPASASLLLIRTSQMDKQNTGCRQALAFFSMQQRKPYEAIRWLGELQKIEPENFTYTKEISRLYVQTSEMEKAESVLIEFLDADPDNAAALHGTAMFFYSLLPNDGKGAKFAQRLVDQAPSGENYALLASIQDAAGKNDEAIEAMSKAAELSPENSKYSDALKVLRGEIIPADIPSSDSSGPIISPPPSTSVPPVVNSGSDQ
ncbi:MAG: tetratricopeptide repeat protein [Planctomycetota bacterium]|nr:tetratricopeptide repeat protein [Planctomycetota bacterium]